MKEKEGSNKTKRREIIEERSARGAPATYSKNEGALRDVHENGSGGEGWRCPLRRRRQLA